MSVTDALVFSMYSAKTSMISQLLASVCRSWLRRENEQSTIHSVNLRCFGETKKASLGATTFNLHKCSLLFREDF